MCGVCEQAVLPLLGNSTMHTWFPWLSALCVLEAVCLLCPARHFSSFSPWQQMGAIVCFQPLFLFPSIVLQREDFVPLAQGGHPDLPALIGAAWGQLKALQGQSSSSCFGIA